MEMSFGNAFSDYEAFKNPNFLSLKAAHDIYSSINVWFRICDKMNIDTSLWAGSLLGCVRHGSIIPWDDDGDAIIFESQADKICHTTFIAELNKYGYNLLLEKLSSSTTVLHIYREPNVEHLTDHPIHVDKKQLFHVNKTKYNRSMPFIKSGLLDIFMLRACDKGYQPTFTKYDRKTDYVTHGDIFPLKDSHLGSRVRVKILNKSEVYITRVYGKEALVRGKVTHFHDAEGKNMTEGNDIINHKQLHMLHLPSFVRKASHHDDTNFAEFVDLHVSRNSQILDLGCGSNGGTTGSLLASQGHEVTGVDFGIAASSGNQLHLVNEDFVCYIDADISKFNAIATRALNYLTSEEEAHFLSKIHQNMGSDCIFVIEMLDSKHSAYKKGLKLSDEEYILDNTYRRFVKSEDLRSRLRDKFMVLHDECGGKVYRLVLKRG
jgi:hypothetical protein